MVSKIVDIITIFMLLVTGLITLFGPTLEIDSLQNLVAALCFFVADNYIGDLGR